MTCYSDNVDSTGKLSLLSLCPGMRGLEIGLERAIGRVRTVAYVEIEAFICQNLVAQMEAGVLDAAPIWTDVKTFLPIAKRLLGKVDIITAGYPCQPFSVAGNRNGKEDSRHLWPYIKDIVGAARPFCCFFENVPGHLTLGYQQVRQDLQELGYTVEEGIFSAEEVGAPHIRKRLFILAVDNANGIRHKQEHKIQTGRNSAEYASETMANSDSGKSSEGRRDDAKVFGLPETECESEYSSAISGRNSNSRGEQLAYSIGTGLEGIKEQPTRKEQSPTERSSRTAWPARPGQPQFEWEAPRLESGLGYTVNGYNYREDLLRMAGNAVVPQVAEKAFRTLINKFDHS